MGSLRRLLHGGGERSGGDADEGADHRSSASIDGTVRCCMVLEGGSTGPGDERRRPAPLMSSSWK
jgi:hypothetical protein